MLPNLERLRVFHHVYVTGSLRDAAQALNVTQSAASQQLAKLEREIGSQLFVRRHKGLVASPASQALARTVELFLREVEGDVEAIRRGQEEPMGLLRVGAPAEFGAQQLPAQIAGFRRSCPGVRFEITLGHPDQLLPRVESGQLDLAFSDVFQPGPQRGALTFQSVLDEELILVASGRYSRNALEGDHSFDRLQRARYVCYTPRAEAVRHWFRHHFRHEPGQLELVLSVESVRGVIASVKADLGLAVVPATQVESELRAGRLIEIQGKGRRILNQIALVQLADQRPGAAQRRFVRFVSRAEES
jgi:DNA-binding transcriptional LysR family regulator